MTESIWVLRDPSGKAIATHVDSADECRMAADFESRIPYHVMLSFGALIGKGPNDTRFEHAGYTLALEPHARPEPSE